ncbi:MAG: AI-2E family transporter [Bacteroidales bacterium]|jgi:predicted PurR-regulated permease PerM
MKIKFSHIVGFLFFLIFGALLWYFRHIVSYIIIAAILSLVGKPLVDLLQRIRYKSWRLSRSLSALLTLMLLWLGIALFFRTFLPLIGEQAAELSRIDVNAVTQKLQEPILQAEELFRKFPSGTQEMSLQSHISEKISEVMNFSIITNLVGSLVGMLGNIFIAIFSISFISFFFLKDDGLLYNAILMLIPDKYVEQVKHVLASVKRLLTRYFIGIVIQISAIILLISIGLLVVGLDLSEALVIGLVAGIMNIIPYIGPIIGTMLGLLLGIATHLHLPFMQELLPLLGWMLLVFMVVQLMDNILFQPLIYSNSVNAHPLEIFLVIMIAGSIAGVAGMILAIPLYTIIRVVAKEFFNNFKVVKKMTEKI